MGNMINNKKLKKEVVELTDYFCNRNLTVLEIKLILDTFLGFEEAKTVIGMVTEDKFK